MRRPGGDLWWHTLGLMTVSGARIQKNPRPSAVESGQLEPIDAPVPLACDGDAMPRCDLSTGLDHSPGPPVKHSAPGSWSFGGGGGGQGTHYPACPWFFSHS